MARTALVAVALAAALAAVAVYMLVLGGGAPGEAAGASGGGGGETLSFGLSMGDRLVYNVTVYTYRDGELNSTSSNTVEVEVVGFLLPLAGVNVSDQGGSPRFVEVPFGLIALPLDWLGSREVSAPFAIGYTWVCVELGLEGRAPSPMGGEALVYRGVVERPNLTLAIEAWYDEATGALVWLEANMTVAAWEGGNATVVLRHELAGFEVSGEGVKGGFQEEYTCGPGVSSDLRFVLEGLYRVGPSGVEPVTGEEVGRAVEGEAVLVVLSKQCPYCQRLWPKLLEATAEAGVEVYAVVYDPASQLATPDLAYVIANIVQPAFNKLDRPGVPALLHFSGGELAGAEVGDMSYGDLVEWLERALKP